MNVSRWPLLASAAGAMVGLSACSGYALRGKVIEGEASWVFVVDADDPRLSGQGVEGARLDAILDPQRLNRKPAGGGASDPSGDFSVPIGEFGAGVLLYDVLVRAEKQGYIPAEQTFALPGREKRVLIMLQRGAAPRTTGGETLLDEIRRHQN